MRYWVRRSGRNCHAERKRDERISPGDSGQRRGDSLAPDAVGVVFVKLRTKETGASEPDPPCLTLWAWPVMTLPKRQAKPDGSLLPGTGIRIQLNRLCDDKEFAKSELS